MAPGVLTTLAFTLVRNFPVAIEDIVTSSDNELDSVRDKLILPTDLARWATILSSRSMCRFDIFSTAAGHEITRYRTMLLEQYPGDGELPQRLHAAGDEMSECLHDSRQLWEQFRMHYDTYYLHLEPTARDAMDKAYAKFEQTMSDLTGRSAGTLAIIEEWRPCFDLLLTEAGCQVYTRTLEERRVWMTETFPGRISEMLEDLQQVRDARVQSLNDSTALWEAILQEWYTHSGDRLPTHVYRDGLHRFMKILDDLVAQCNRQRTALGQLKSCMRLVDHHTTTLNLVSAEEVSIEDVRESFHQFDTTFVQCMRTKELCLRLQMDLRERIAILMEVRDQV
ncbi:hypothetical protein C8Q76DRAFT_792427 [Earliella scabrosa]|nr:hypothetical protein C8Q76DRAFT_792427 [Earliella scabrosa]